MGVHFTTNYEFEKDHSPRLELLMGVKGLVDCNQPLEDQRLLSQS